MLMVQKTKSKKNRLRAIRGKCARGGLRYPSAIRCGKYLYVFKMRAKKLFFAKSARFFVLNAQFG
jgi:hypothetical protein